MYLRHFEIRNYKSFRAETTIDFLPGFNIITGKNNAGKTSLLEALALNFNPLPHRSLQTVPAVGLHPPQISSALMTFVLSREELLILLRSSPFQYSLIKPANTFRFPDGKAYDGGQQASQAFVEWFLSHEQLTVKVRRSIDFSSHQEKWEAVEPTFGLYDAEVSPTGERSNFIIFTLSNEGAILSISYANSDTQNNLCVWLMKTLRPRIYRFFAERFNVSQSPMGVGSLLTGNASNLPEVLNSLQGNPRRFLQLNQLLHDILSQVQQVSVHPSGGNNLEIRAWPHDPASQREDLALPLNQCGSGIGQVLAILYVVLTAVHPQVILIDEPQSLLHPGAARKLIEVLKQFPQHQYIIATHSPTVIAAANPSIIWFVKLEDTETRFQAINARQTQELQLYLGDIGARLSDVFGADNILWVEGQTEEIAFPVILNQMAHRSLMGTAIIGLKQTGDLEGRDAKRVFELYRRLIGATALLPPALAFIIDRECRSNDLREELRRESQSKVHFLPRRMFENYLLCARGIAAVANEIEGFRAQPITEDEVSVLIENKRLQRAYFCGNPVNIPANWVNEIDGSRVLKEIFQELSENRVVYDKVRHSIAITKWLIANQARDLEELANLLLRLIPQ